MTGKLVQIEWVDSGRSGGWESTDDALRAAAEDPMLCYTAGWLIADNDRYVLIAPSQKPPHKPGEGEVLNSLQIPKEAVREIRALTVGRRVPT